MEQYLITLLVKTGLAAALASFGVRSHAVQRMLQREERTLAQKLRLVAWFVAMFLPGVGTRVLTGNYPALDMGMEGSLLAGLTGGYVCGWVTGGILAIPAMFHGETLSLPFFSIVGLAGGLLRDSASDREDIWHFSPFPDVNIYRIFQPGRDLRSALLHAYFALAVLAVEFLRQALGTAFRNPPRLFTLGRFGDRPWNLFGLYVATYFCITLPLKVWSNTRGEAKIEEQRRLLLQARLEALSSQINPHFLFNTLNSVSTLIRLDPEQARTMVTRLARIMRKRLQSPDHFTALRDEIEFMDDYLSIERVRFGDKLRVIKQIEAAAADVSVPSMLLQPLVENSIKHGISSKVEGGTITLTARLVAGRLIVEVQDDGVGISAADLAVVFSKGIGVSNVRERLEVLYGRDYRMEVDSAEGRGTRIEIDVPEIRQKRKTA
ncbi:MAG: signal transduction histidine kinase, LytS [Bryobacterales bacterium]|nr:signal transduction histidine kinase, LytS [Bryobacterales bacterium]